MKFKLILIAFLIWNCSIAQVSDFKTTDFTVADNVAKLYKGASLDNLPLLAHNLTKKLPTEVEKFRAIYVWVCNNIEGDSYQHKKVSRKRKKLKGDSIGLNKWNAQYKKTAFKKLIKHKKTMCTGYAYLLKELCFFANIDCEIIDGYGRSVSSNVEALNLPNHSWNAVKLNNKWYLCDPTWSSGYMIGDGFFLNDYNDGYFLTEPVLFAKNHFPIHKKWFLNESLIQSRFIASPIVYGETFKHKVIPVSPKKMEVTINKNDDVNFSFNTLQSVSESKISLIQFRGTTEKRFKIHDIKNENNMIQFKCKFENKGFYDVHLKIDNDVVATYSVEVLKS